LRAGVGGAARAAVAGAGPVVRLLPRSVSIHKKTKWSFAHLHQTWVLHAVVGRRDADAALGFLHHDGEDEALINAGRLSNGLNGGLDVGGLLVGVVVLAELCARDGNDGHVVGPHGVKVNPVALRRPALRCAAVT
jgi:hypothetical protein